MDLEIRHLKLVEAIAAAGSVTRAGEQLHLTQSALSHQLLGIEERLGTRLFVRLKRRMVPTPAGERLLQSARTVLAHLRDTEEEIRRQARAGEGLIRIAVECYTCYHWLPALLGPFHKRHPRVEIRIAAEETAHPVKALLEGRLDLALVSSPVRDPRLSARHLVDDEMVVVMAPDHPLAERPFVRPQDLAAENLFMYTDPEDNTTMQRVLRPAGVTPRRMTRITLTEAILELVGAGQGVAVLASWSIAPAVAAKAVCARPLTRRGFVRRWQSVRLKAAGCPDWLQGFEDLLVLKPPAGRLRPALLRPVRTRKAG